jgi:hypothetical protein
LIVDGIVDADAAIGDSMAASQGTSGAFDVRSSSWEIYDPTTGTFSGPVP